MQFGRPSSPLLTFISLVPSAKSSSLFVTTTRKDGARLGYISSYSKHLTEFDFSLHFHKAVQKIRQCIAEIKSNRRDQSQGNVSVRKVLVTDA